MKSLLSLKIALGVVIFSLSALQGAQAQTPVIDGQIAPGEYGSSYVTGGQTWYMAWDETNLYVATTFAGVGEATVMYFDTNPDRSTIVNNVNNAGTTEGFLYDNTSGTLPFSADAVIYVKPSDPSGGYREVRKYSAELGRWGDQKTGIGTVEDNNNNVREFSIPWAEISTTNARPADFNWFGYVTNGGGFVYAQVPFFNPEGSIGTNASFVRYFTVLNTAAGSNTRAFGPNNVDSYSHSGSGNDTFGAITVYDFTLNTPSGFITRAGDGSSWNIRGNLRVGNGNLNLGNSTASVSVAGDLTFANAAAFTAGNASVFLVGNGNQTINGDIYSSLTIQGTGIKTLVGDNMIIQNSLILNNGTLATGPLLVDLGSAGSLSETAGYLLGNVQATRSITGPGRFTFGGIGLAITTSSGGPGSVTAQRVTGGFGIDGTVNQNKTIRRRFFLNAPGSPTLPSSIEFTYRNANPNELEGNNPANLALYRSTNGRTGPYTQVATATDNSSSTTKTFNTSLAFDGSFYSLSDGTQPLPVELISFTGRAENNAVRLSWATASELHNKGFEIERRTDQSEWKNIGFVAGNGTTNQRHNYTYVDRSTAAGNNYYRLRQLDLDGKSVYSQPVVVQVGAVALTLSPVPTTDVLTFNGLGDGKHVAEIYNARGQRVLSQEFKDAAATTVTVRALPAGVYMVRVLGADRSTQKARFIKQ